MTFRLHVHSPLLLILIGMGFFALPHDAAASTPNIEIVGPTPHAIQYQDTTVTYEVALLGGENTHDIKIEWQPIWNGFDTEFPVPAPYTVTLTNVSFPLFGKDNDDLRFSYTIGHLEADGHDEGQKWFRVRVTDLTDEPDSSVIESNWYYLIKNVAFSGYTWSGASTDICIGGGTPGMPCDLDSDCGPGGRCGNDALGWTSFSCANQNTTCQAFSGYGVTIGSAKDSSGTSRGTLSDNAWIGSPEVDTGDVYSIGWMSFNRQYCNGGDRSGMYCVDSAACPGGGTCQALGAPPVATPPDPPLDLEDWSSLPDASYIYNSVEDVGGERRYPGQVAGWARLLGIRDYGESINALNEWGWVHLRGKEALAPYTTVAADAYRQCSDCSVGGTKCNVCNLVNQAVGDPKPYSCNSCYDTDIPRDGFMEVCERCDEYGVSYDSRKGKLVGYGWGGKEEESGIGWVQFNPSLGGIGILQAWLATRYGDIFVGGSINITGALPTSPENFNATYVIQANGTIAFTSQAGYVQPDYPSLIPLPTRGNQYINVLGRLDFNTMALSPGQNDKTHRYGETIRVTGGDLDAYLNALPDQKLDGKIYYYEGDAEINSPVTFRPGAAATENGSGTIIVDGDLTISAPVLYDTSGVIGSLANLPSVAWLVRGNVKIEPVLGHAEGTGEDPNLVGAFIVVGYAGGAGPEVTCNGLPTTAGGVLSTGAPPPNTYLVVNGLMMAKCFNFQRTIQLADIGSEHIVYDGRLIANPPPGLQDLTAVLPVIREVTPE